MKTVKIELTIPQAYNLLIALGNSTCFDDTMTAIFNNKNQIKSCLLAEEKIKQAIKKAES